MFTSKFVLSLFMVLCAISGGSLKQIPDYIEVCKRDQNTINECVLKSIEKIRPKLAEGIPELQVPTIEPFVIPQIVVDSGNVVQFVAIGNDVKVSGASNFTIKNIDVDLDTFTIRGRVRFPKLHFAGRYTVDARVLVLPLKGQGNILADAVKCDAEIVIKSKFIEKDGQEYIQFDQLNMDITVRDYRVKLDGLFNGDKTLGDAANEAINQNRGEFLKASKPYVEKTASKILLQTANKIASTFPIDDLLPNP